MKNILIFLLFFLSISCSSNTTVNESGEIIACPQVFFSAKHRNYLEIDDKSLVADNLSLKAEINNFYFKQPCKEMDNLYFFPLDVLFIINLNKTL